MGAVLTQQTTWVSAEKALRELKDRGLMSLENLSDAPLEVLEECVRPTGFYRVKARRLRTMARHILEREGGLTEFLSLDAPTLRGRLLDLPGVGFETADSILLYAVGHRFFVVDAYTRRIVGRLGKALPSGYEEARGLLEAELPGDVNDYQEAHALMVELGKRYCRTKPLCASCPLLRLCPHGQRVEGRG